MFSVPFTKTWIEVCGTPSQDNCTCEVMFRYIVPGSHISLHAHCFALQTFKFLTMLVQGMTKTERILSFMNIWTTFLDTNIMEKVMDEIETVDFKSTEIYLSQSDISDTS